MSKIVCKLFGVPKITKDGQSVFLPYAKINALLYYILVSKVVSRDEVVGLLWPDEDEKIAKKKSAQRHLSGQEIPGGGHHHLS